MFKKKEVARVREYRLKAITRQHCRVNLRNFARFCQMYNTLKMHKEVAYNSNIHIIPVYVKSVKTLHF